MKEVQIEKLTSLSGCTSCQAWSFPVAERETSAKRLDEVINTEGMKNKKTISTVDTVGRSS